MNLFNAFKTRRPGGRLHDDELDALLQWGLQAPASAAVPDDAVWQRIAAGTRAQRRGQMRAILRRTLPEGGFHLAPVEGVRLLMQFLYAKLGDDSWSRFVDGPARHASQPDLSSPMSLGFLLFAFAPRQRLY